MTNVTDIAMSSSLLRGSAQSTPRNGRLSYEESSSTTRNGAGPRQSAQPASSGVTFRRPNKDALSLSLSGASMSSAKKVRKDGLLSGFSFIWFDV